MKRGKALPGALVLGALVAHAAPVRAQATVGADLALYSSYVWRGLTLTNKPVAQPNLYLSFPAGGVSFTAGGWANVDIGEYDDPNDDLSESGGLSAFNLAEFNPYAEVSVPAGKATLSAGVIGYVFPNDAGLTEDFNTWEVYGKVGLAVPLAPEIAVYYDVDKVNGAYIEGTVGHALPLSETLSLELGGLVAFSAGQAFDVNSDDTANFLDNGLTHLDLSAGLPLTAGLFSITPSLHFQINSDDFTKVTSPTDPDSDLKLWGGVSIGWARAVGAAPGGE